MSKGKEKNCRLCLKILDDDYNTIEEITRVILKVLLIKIDLSVSEEPLVCNSCMESVQQAFDFKSTCLAVDQQVVLLSIDRNSAELDIIDVYLKQNENKNVVFNEEYNICRFCLQCLEKRNFNLLNDLRQGLNNEMLLKCIPELHLDKVKESVVCTGCMESLEAYYSFTLKCRFTEESIIKYREVQGAECTGEINLGNVTKFLIKEEYIDNCNETSAFIGLNEGNTYSDMNNLIPKIENEEFIFKTENNEDCKTEENIYHDIVYCDMPTYKDPLDAVMFRCALCTFETKRKYNLKKHMRIHKDNSEVNMYKCNLCSYGGKCRSELTDHMLVHKDHEDGYCQNEENIYHEARQNETVYHDKPTYKDTPVMYRCQQCTFETKYNRSLSRHMHSIHKDNSEVNTYKCNLCSYATKLKGRLIDHMLTHKDPSDIVMFRCTLCKFETKRKSGLKKHMLIHKDNSEVNIHKCNLCSYEAKWKSKLTDHMLVHKDPSDIVMFRCALCTFETKRKHSLQNHVLIHKDSSEVIMHNCNLCSFKSKRKSDLTTHLSVHHNNSADAVIYRCKICTFETKHRSSLRKHVLIHKDRSEWKYSCNLCSFKSRWKMGLRCHLLTHKDSSNTVMFRCTFCTFETKYKHSLKAHTLVHKDNSEVNMYKCDLCSYETKWKKNLKYHMLTHKDPSDIVMYKCEKCTYETNRKSNLKLHVRRHEAKSEVIM